MHTVMNWLWQGTVIAGTASVMLLCLRRTRASTRYAVCWVTSLLILALPLFPFVLAATPATNAILPVPADAVVSLPDAWWTSTVTILAAWLVWGSIHFVRFVAAIVAIRRARARSRAFPAHLEAALPCWSRVRLDGRRATLVLSNSVTSAAVLGWGAPMIAVAPSLVRALEPDDLDRVLIHEWAHVQRYDDVVNVLQIIVRTVAGWHPGLWWMDRRLHEEREIACDEKAVTITGSPKSYAACLMKLTTVAASPLTMLTSPVVFGPSGLRARVVKIVSPYPLLAPVWARGLAATILLVLCVVSITVGGRVLVDAAEFTMPLVSAPIHALELPADRPLLVTNQVPAAKAERLTRRVSSAAPSPARPAPEERAQSEVTPSLEATAVPSPQTPAGTDSSHTAQPAPEPPPSIATESTSTPQTQVSTPDVTAQASRSPWSAAAAGGAAIGRTSKDAGVATAGFFTRFARRVAGSF